MAYSSGMSYFKILGSGNETMINVTDYEAILVDLDGTLVDTSGVNYMAYEAAVSLYGYHIDYVYFKNYCNGRHYLEFLPQLTTDDKKILEAIHQVKKELYKNYLNEARVNVQLVDILRTARESVDNTGKRKCKTGLVTTASRKNTIELLAQYELLSLFDVIITQEDVIHKKPNPEGYIKAMDLLKIDAERVLVFEDSDAGIEAARRSGIRYIEEV